MTDLQVCVLVLCGALVLQMFITWMVIFYTAALVETTIVSSCTLVKAVIDNRWAMGDELQRVAEIVSAAREYKTVP